MTDPFDLSAATVLITGGGTGLGKQFAKTLALAGARVIIAARRVDKLQETVAEISAAGGSPSSDFKERNTASRSVSRV